MMLVTILFGALAALFAALFFFAARQSPPGVQRA